MAVPSSGFGDLSRNASGGRICNCASPLWLVAPCRSGGITGSWLREFPHGLALVPSTGLAAVLSGELMTVPSWGLGDGGTTGSWLQEVPHGLELVPSMGLARMPSEWLMAVPLWGPGEEAIGERATGGLTTGGPECPQSPARSRAGFGACGLGTGATGSAAAGGVGALAARRMAGPRRSLAASALDRRPRPPGSRRLHSSPRAPTSK
mmetsp:Transcript_5930/g.12009  ORF Transcript_5930/g.12009 Transcript_5930/m.12009 type:complete len:207 (-) Transcript_5930:525-1145(-)